MGYEQTKLSSHFLSHTLKLMRILRLGPSHPSYAPVSLNMALLACLIHVYLPSPGLGMLRSLQVYTKTYLLLRLAGNSTL